MACSGTALPFTFLQILQGNVLFYILSRNSVYLVQYLHRTLASYGTQGFKANSTHVRKAADEVRTTVFIFESEGSKCALGD
jgi:hypothetical protein